MKKICLLLVLCFCLCGCGNEKITICSSSNAKTTIKHKNDKITFIKYETMTNYETLTEAIQQEQKMNKILEDNKKSENADKEFKWYVERNDKTVILIQESSNYNNSYFKELEKIEDLQTCVEQ